MTDQSFHAEFNLAKKTLVDASKIVLPYLKKAFTITYKEGDASSSIVTQADEETEDFIRKSLEKKFPDHGFIGEETTECKKNTAWIVDPIDGTLAFSRRLPDFGMALALKNGSDVVFSVMYIPYFDKLYTAYTSEGAFLNNKQIKASNTDSIPRSIISLHQKGIRLKKFRDYSENILNSCTVRMSHSSVVESCLVAEGKIDGLIKFEQKIWDLAPEYRLMHEAGATITDEYGDSIIFDFSKDSRQTFVALSDSIVSAGKDSLYLSKS